MELLIQCNDYNNLFLFSQIAIFHICDSICDDYESLTGAILYKPTHHSKGMQDRRPARRPTTTTYTAPRKEGGGKRYRMIIFV